MRTPIVIYGKNIGAAQAEDEKHLHRPAPDSAHLGKVLDDGFVRHAPNAGEAGDRAIDGLGREIAQGEALIVGEAGGTQLLIRGVEQVLGIG